MRKMALTVFLAALVALALPSVPSSASTYNYLAFTNVSLDCSTTPPTAVGSIVYSLQPGAKVVADVNVHSNTPPADVTVHQEYTATVEKYGARTENWNNVSGGNPFPVDGYMHVTVKVYDPDGTLASVTEAYGECPSGSTWIRGWGVPGADSFVQYTPWAVGGTLVRDALLYAEPNVPTNPPITLEAGKNVVVLGMDASGQYYKIVFAASYLWVEADAIGPNYDAVWGGAPLPTQVVE